MAAKAILVLCAQALLVQSIYSQAIPCANTIGTAMDAEEYALAGNALAYGSNLAGRGMAAGPIGYPGCNSYGLAPNSFIPSSGGCFAVTSVSSIAPTGITVVSENAIEGAVVVNGELPFLSAVVVEGAVPTAGTGGVNYGCGNGAVGIMSEGTSPAVASAAAYPAGLGYAPGVAGGHGYSAGLGGRGLGFGMGGCSGIY